MLCFQILSSLVCFFVVNAYFCAESAILINFVMTKFLIIRFSSIGDIIQCMGIIGGIRERFADVEIHWITRKDMVGDLVDGWQD